jgi:hypothetical protein
MPRDADRSPAAANVSLLEVGEDSATRDGIALETSEGAIVKPFVDVLI